MTRLSEQALESELPVQSARRSSPASQLGRQRSPSRQVAELLTSAYTDWHQHSHDSSPPRQPPSSLGERRLLWTATSAVPLIDKHELKRSMARKVREQKPRNGVRRPPQRRHGDPTVLAAPPRRAEDAAAVLIADLRDLYRGVGAPDVSVWSMSSVLRKGYGGLS